VAAAPGGLGPVTILNPGNVYRLDEQGNFPGQLVASNFCGVYENFAYQITDQAPKDQPIVNGVITGNESFTDVTFGQVQGNPFTQDLSTRNWFPDIMAYGYIATPAGVACPGIDEHQTFNQHWSVTVGSVAYPLTTVIHIERGNFAGAPNVTSTITTK
jgi:hypothetical protein